MIKDPETLRKAINILLEHKKEAEEFSRNYFAFMNIKERELSLENMQKILLLDIHSRGRALMSRSECEEIVRQFNSKMDIEQVKRKEGIEKFNYIYEQLISIDQIGPKIAAVVMKNMVYYLKICPELMNLLYMPIDRHIRKIFIEKIKVFEEKDVPQPSDPFSTNKNKRFQEALLDIHQPRIEFDLFWFVGYFFCNKRIACHLCWLRKLCKNPYFEGKNLNI